MACSCHNQRLWKVEISNEDRLEKRFAYYLFASDLVRSQIRGSATGATVRHSAQQSGCSQRSGCRRLAPQRRIAEVLRAYDGLIEINTRRIKILEEVAQSITTTTKWGQLPATRPRKRPLVDSRWDQIPEGWEVAPLGELCSRLQAGGTPRREARKTFGRMARLIGTGRRNFRMVSCSIGLRRSASGNPVFVCPDV